MTSICNFKCLLADYEYIIKKIEACVVPILNHSHKFEVYAPCGVRCHRLTSDACHPYPFPQLSRVFVLPQFN